MRDILICQYSYQLSAIPKVICAKVKMIRRSESGVFLLYSEINVTDITV